MRAGQLVFSAIDRIVFGQPVAQTLATEVERFGARRVFLLVSRTMNGTTDEVTKLLDVLKDRYAGLYEQMPSHTPRDAVLRAADKARKAGADLIVTFGGGSVTDAGKMVRLCLMHNITNLDGFDAFRASVTRERVTKEPHFSGPTVPQVTIPTTLSAGEFHAEAGCTDNRSKVKQAYRHPMLVPRVVILDPAPTVHTPLWVWLSTGVRAVDHAAEGFCSPLSNPVSDASFLHALRLLSEALPRVKRDSGDLEARLDCQLATWLAMAGRQAGAKMGVSHAIGHALGGTCGVPHGYTSCVMLPHALRFNSSVTGERQRLIAAAMGHPGKDAADVIAAFIADLGLPRRLSEVGVSADQFSVIAANTMHDLWLPANPRTIEYPEQIIEILTAAT